MEKRTPTYESRNHHPPGQMQNAQPPPTGPNTNELYNHRPPGVKPIGIQ